MKFSNRHSFDQAIQATFLFVIVLLPLGCGKNDPPQATDVSASSSDVLKSKPTQKIEPIVGKWATDSGHIIELRQDGRFTIEPFSGNQTVGSYIWNAASKEIIASVNTGLGKLDALWPVQITDNDSFTVSVKDERMLGKRGEIKFLKYRDGQPEMKADGETLRATEGMAFDQTGQITMANVGTGTLLLRIGRGQFHVLFPGISASFSLPLKSEAREAGNSLTETIDYQWKKPSGEIERQEVRCTVQVERAEATRLELGKALKTDPKFSWQWFQFEIPSRDSAGQSPQMYAVVRTPTGHGEFFDNSRSGKPPLDIVRSYTPANDFLGWLGVKPQGTTLWRVNSFGKPQTVALMPTRYVLKQIESASGSAKPLPAGETFTLDGRQCPEGGLEPHTTCWAAISFEAKLGRFYPNAFSNTAREAGWDASLWILPDEKYQRFKSANAKGGMNIYRSEILGNWSSTLNPSDFPLWTAPSEGTFWLLFHYSKKFSRDHYKNDCKAWVYEVPNYQQGEFSFVPSN